LPIEKAFVLIRRFAADVPVATLAPGSAARWNRDFCSTVRAVCLAGHSGRPPVPVRLSMQAKIVIDRQANRVSPRRRRCKKAKGSDDGNERARATVTRCSNHALKQW